MVYKLMAVQGRCTMPCIYYLSIKGWHCWDWGTGFRKERETGREKLKRKGGWIHGERPSLLCGSYGDKRLLRRCFVDKGGGEDCSYFHAPLLLYIYSIWSCFFQVWPMVCNLDHWLMDLLAFELFTRKGSLQQMGLTYKITAPHMCWHQPNFSFSLSIWS